MGGFSFASVILSYFLIAGGLFTGGLAYVKIGSASDVVALALLAAGSFVGGFFAARASRGSTIVEPAIGAVLLVVPFLVLAFGTHSLDVLKESSSAAKLVGEITGAMVVGALLGAFLSEKILGEATESAVPWIFYASFASFGASITSALIVSGILVRGGERSSDKQTTMMSIGLAIGCILAGIVIGASAKIRVAAASFVGGLIGIALMGLFVAVALGTSHNKDMLTGVAVMAVVGGILTVFGSMIGWATIGKNAA
ncbi:hypothetical protein BH11MYX1_BH11MYX1_40920 [soil metagenome]